MNKITAFRILATPLLALSLLPAVAEETSEKPTRAESSDESKINVKATQTEEVDERESYSALGLRVGGFMLYPTLESENEWTDNVYSRQTDTKSDFIFHIKPQLNIRSNWNRHALNLMAGSDVMFYKDYSTEDKQNYWAGIDGRFDVLKDSFATAKLYYNNVKENRGSPEPVASLAVNPLENETFGAKAGYEHKINRTRINVAHDIKHIDFKDGRDAFGAAVLNSQRTRTVNTSEIRLGYELFSGYEAYLKGGYNFVDYKKLFTNQNNLDRSSQGYSVVTGVSADIGHTLVGDAYIGYQHQNYKDSRLKSIGGMTGGLTLTWLPTRLTTVKTGVDRSIQETTQTNLSGFFSTSLTASIDHELLRNVLLNAHAGYTNNDYHGTNVVNRQEDLYSAGFNIKYLLNRYLYMKTGYDYKTRSVNLNGNDYDINSAYFTIGTQM